MLQMKNWMSIIMHNMYIVKCKINLCVEIWLCFSSISCDHKFVPQNILSYVKCEINVITLRFNSSIYLCKHPTPLYMSLYGYLEM